MDENKRKASDQQQPAAAAAAGPRAAAAGPRRFSGAAATRSSQFMVDNNGDNDPQASLNGSGGGGGRRTSYFEFKEAGQARLVLSRDFFSFDGVLISDGANDSYILKGRFEESDQPNGHLTCNVLVIDGDSGNEYHIKDIAVIVDHSDELAATNSTKDYGKISALSRAIQSQVSCSQVAAANRPVITEQPRNGKFKSEEDNKKPPFEPMGHHPSNSDLKPMAIKMRCESLEFDTEQVLVGNRADTEISQFVSPELVGQGLTVCTGPMRVDVCKFFTPHKAFSARRMSKEFYEQFDTIKQNDFLQ